MNCLQLLAFAFTVAIAVPKNGNTKNPPDSYDDLFLGDREGNNYIVKFQFIHI